MVAAEQIPLGGFLCKDKSARGCARWGYWGSGVRPALGAGQEDREVLQGPVSAAPRGRSPPTVTAKPPFPVRPRTDLARPGWALGARAARGGAPGAAPALGRAGAQGAGALLALRRGRRRRASGPPGAAVAPPGRSRRARRRPPVPLEHGLPVWRGERLRRWRRP